MKIYDVAVIGGGAAGMMAVLRTCLNNDQCLFFPGNAKDRKKSREFWVSKVENMPDYSHYHKGIVDPNKNCLDWIQGSSFSKNLAWQKNRSVQNLKRIENDLFQLTDDQGNHFQARYVILCTGVMDIQPIINGSIQEILPYANVQLADYCLRCDGHHVAGKKTTVITNSSSGVWVAVMLHERYQPPAMTVLFNGSRVELNQELQQLVKLYNISLVDGNIQSIAGNAKQGQLEAFLMEDDSRVEAQVCFIALGMLVYNQLAKDLGAKLDERGFVLTDANGESSLSGLYVAGDLRANAKKQIYTAWDHAVDSADAINAKLRRQRRMEHLKSFS
jgi:thioredoxin reductase (NADPH)